MTELDKREKRKSNVIIHGLDEFNSDVTDGRVRKSEVLAKLQSLVDALNVQIQTTSLN